MRPSLFAAVATGALTLAAASAGHAAIVSGTSGTVYLSTASSTVDPTLTGPGDATFTPGPIDYNPTDDPSVYTIGAFLNNPTFSNESAAFAVDGGNTSFSYGNGNTQINITGTLTLKAGNNSFTLGHDDGVVLDIPGISYTLSDPNPTSFTTTPFTVFNPGAAGTYSYTLYYEECCGPPAALVFAVNGVPEPATWGLMLTGFGIVGAAVRRKSRLASA